MCAGALSLMGLHQVFYGAANDKFGGCGSIMQVHDSSCGCCSGRWVWMRMVCLGDAHAEVWTRWPQLFTGHPVVQCPCGVRVPVRRHSCACCLKKHHPQTATSAAEQGSSTDKVFGVLLLVGPVQG